MLEIRMVKSEDLARLVVLENLCFEKEEAASEEAFKKRIEVIADSFFVAEKDGVIVGMINGPVIDSAYITDDLFREIKANPSTGGHQSVLGLAVSPDCRNHGIASILLAYVENEARVKHRQTITLTCKENYISFYEKHGFINYGISSSVHGGFTWYDLIKPID
ncbi:GNAT family N-acetyltransferase [Bacillus sp. USDA818B3_A]|uniref:GNAT family N-acetyltransferase n=1 Tax=Bacillus sp. USDA818B3_A TaxID=2698834 RepID=UPI00136862BF|nr:GNAT family N-acetyltransferase [Bacillus sp. USDA818B3_A]